jgi:hypothetical protein
MSIRRVAVRAFSAVCLGLSVGLAAGCGAVSSGREIPPTSSPSSAITPTTTSVSSVVVEVQLGTGLRGTGDSAMIVNSTNSFKPSDRLAFVIHLRTPINATKVSCLIYDPLGNILYSWDQGTQPSDTVLASSTPPLGTVIPAGDPPGIYQLVVFQSPTALVNYADGANFTYTR